MRELRCGLLDESFGCSGPTLASELGQSQLSDVLQRTRVQWELFDYSNRARRVSNANPAHVTAVFQPQDVCEKVRTKRGNLRPFSGMDTGNSSSFRPQGGFRLYAARFAAHVDSRFSRRGFLDLRLLLTCRAMDYLWTPWRYAYVSSTETSGGCVFCNAPKSKDDAKTGIVYRGEHCFVILNAY